MYILHHIIMLSYQTAWIIFISLENLPFLAVKINTILQQ